jgi:hypothetical protein
MGDTYKPRPEVLQEFIRVLHLGNPMQLNLEGNPGAENEYDSEAMSILARLNERAVQCCPYRDLALDIVYSVLQETFVFWFQQPIRDEDSARVLTTELLNIFDASYGEISRAEHAPPSEVGSDHEEERAGDGSSGLPGVTPGETPPGSG